MTAGSLPTALPAEQGSVRPIELLGIPAPVLLTLMLLTIGAVILEVQRRQWSRSAT